MSEVAGQRIAVIGGGESALESAAVLPMERGTARSSDRRPGPQGALARRSPPPRSAARGSNSRSDGRNSGPDGRPGSPGSPPALMRCIRPQNVWSSSGAWFGPAGACGSRSRRRCDRCWSPSDSSQGRCEQLDGELTVEGTEGARWSSATTSSPRPARGAWTSWNSSPRRCVRRSKGRPTTPRSPGTSSRRVPGLHFVGRARNEHLGPVMRFVFGHSPSAGHPVRASRDTSSRAVEEPPVGCPGHGVAIVRTLPPMDTFRTNTPKPSRSPHRPRRSTTSWPTSPAWASGVPSAPPANGTTTRTSRSPARTPRPTARGRRSAASTSPSRASSSRS